MSLDAVVHATVAEMRGDSPSPPTQTLPLQKSSFDRPCTPRKPSPTSSTSSTSSRQSSTHSSSPRTPTQQRRRRKTPTPPTLQTVDDAETTIQKARALFNPPSTCPSISSTRSTSSTSHNSSDEIDSKELRIEVTTIPIECLSPCVMQWSKPRCETVKSGNANGNGNNAANLAKKIRKILNLNPARKVEENFDEKDEKWETGSVRRYRV